MAVSVKNSSVNMAADDAEFRPLTAEQAQALRQKNPSGSPWRVVGLQLVVGLVVALVVWGVTLQAKMGMSAAYGALAVAIPAAIFARGLTGRSVARSSTAAVVGFFVWEFVKVALTVAMLFAAPKLVVGLSWPAMLVAMMLTLQVYWMAFVFSPKKR